MYTEKVEIVIFNDVCDSLCLCVVLCRKSVDILEAKPEATVGDPRSYFMSPEAIDSVISTV